jgi:predicted kinase
MAEPEDRATTDLVAQALRAPVVGVLVGTSGSGKTTLRRAVVAAGLPEDHVVSLDDLRHAARQDALDRGLLPRRLQDYSAVAVRRATRRQDVMAALGTGYLADATHLRRRDRRVHVLTARGAGLPAVAVLMPEAELTELLARNARRSADEQVPDDVLARQHHRRSLLSATLLHDEGFDRVLEL